MILYLERGEHKNNMNCKRKANFSTRCKWYNPKWTFKSRWCAMMKRFMNVYPILGLYNSVHLIKFSIRYELFCVPTADWMREWCGMCCVCVLYFGKVFCLIPFEKFLSCAAKYRAENGSDCMRVGVCFPGICNCLAFIFSSFFFETFAADFV